MWSAFLKHWNGVSLFRENQLTTAADFELYTFFGFLRCAEFTCGDGFDPDYNLCVADLSLQEDPALLTLKYSKTDHFRTGVVIKMFCNGSQMCPRCQLVHYMGIRNIYFPVKSHSDPLFIIQDGSAMSRKIFKKCWSRHFKQRNCPTTISPATRFASGRQLLPPQPK